MIYRGMYLDSDLGNKFGGVQPNCISYADANLLPKHTFFPKFENCNNPSVYLRGIYALNLLQKAFSVL